METEQIQEIRDYLASLWRTGSRAQASTGDVIAGLYERCTALLRHLEAQAPSKTETEGEGEAEGEAEGDATKT